MIYFFSTNVVLFAKRIHRVEYMYSFIWLTVNYIEYVHILDLT